MKHVPIKTLISDKISGEWGNEAPEGSGVYVIRTGATCLAMGLLAFYAAS